jgi:hypothetical protein
MSSIQSAVTCHLPNRFYEFSMEIVDNYTYLKRIIFSSSERKFLKPVYMETYKNTENGVDIIISYHL